MIRPGNIDLRKRPLVRNPDGSYSTVRSMSFGTDIGETLVPTVVGDRVVSDKQAMRHFYKTGQNLGVFTSPQAANIYAALLHRQQALYYRSKILQALKGNR